MDGNYAFDYLNVLVYLIFPFLKFLSVSED